jgi:hypothetical protein
VVRVSIGIYSWTPSFKQRILEPRRKHIAGVVPVVVTDRPGVVTEPPGPVVTTIAEYVVPGERPVNVALVDVAEVAAIGARIPIILRDMVPFTYIADAVNVYPTVVSPV